MPAIDPRTGRSFGDHGTAQEAIDFALDAMGSVDGWAVATFLRCWREGDLESYPEFYLWLVALKASAPRKKP